VLEELLAKYAKARDGEVAAYISELTTLKSDNDADLASRKHDLVALNG